MGMFTEWRDDEIAKLQQQLQEAQTEIERLALEIENRQYTITCASEENLQLKKSLAEARAEIERQTDRIMSDACIISTAALAIAERDKLIEQMKTAMEAALKNLKMQGGSRTVIEAIKAALSAAERINK